jgi:hypothetical protein
MNFKILMMIKAAVNLVLGTLILIVPEFVYGLFGATLNAGGIFAAREYGAAMYGNLMITWFARTAVASPARWAIILGLCVYDAIGVVVTLIALLNGTLNALGWGILLIYLFFAVGFGYYLVRPPKP